MLPRDLPLKQLMRCDLRGCSPVAEALLERLLARRRFRSASLKVLLPRCSMRLELELIRAF